VRSGIKLEEKSIIRSRLFQGSVEEEEKNLALHNSLVAGKIIRIDFPQEWPDAISSLIGLLRGHKNGNKQHLHGSLQIMLRVVKELTTARLRRSQTALQSVTPEIVYLFGEIYAEQTAVWIEFLTNGRGDEDDADMAMQNSLFAVRTLRRLLILGYENPREDKTVLQFWTLSQNHFGQMLGLVSHDSIVPAPYQDMIGKHLLQFTKLHIEMADTHAASFAALPNSLPLVHAYWDLVANFAEVFDKSGGIRQSSGGPSDTKSKVEGPLLERLALKGLLLLRSCVRIAFQPARTIKYRSPEIREEQSQVHKIIREELLNNDFVVRMVNIIITHLFVFRKADLDAWEQDPEEWEQQEQSEGSAYQWEVRPCAERLFLDLLVNYKELLIPPLLSYFQTASGPEADIATKEAVYTAMGLAAPCIFNFFDFDGVFASTIVRDAQQTGPLCKVLRRRIAILTSQWVTVKISDQTRLLIYELFRHLLNPGDETNDTVVRITAARQLRWIADEIDFNAEAFFPYTSDMLAQLVEMVQTIEVDETKLAILESIRLIVTRMETRVSEFGDFIMSALPGIWENAGTDEYMIKQAVIAIFSALVMSMGGSSQRYQHLMIPLLGEAARPGSDLHVHLIDESLELWNSIMMQTSPPISNELLGIAGLALPILEYQPQTAEAALSVVDGYIILAPAAVLEDGLRQRVLVALSDVLSCKSREMVRVGTICVENLIRAAAELGGSNGVSVIIQDMLSTGFLGKIMEGLHGAWEAHQTTGPNRKSSQLNTVTQGDYFAVLSRLLLADPALFATAITTFGSIEEVWTWLGGEWFSYLGGMDHLEHQKLYLMGLSRLLELPQPMQNLVLSKLQDYFTMWANVISELQDGVANSTDSLIWGEVETTEYDTPKSICERTVAEKDPVHSIHALEFVKPRLHDLIQRVGGQQQFEAEWAANVDTDVLRKFAALTNGPGQ
jgi:hypothetical protein